VSFKKGKSIRKGPPKRKLRADIMKMIGELKESHDGGFECYDKKHNCTHKSCLWELPYAKALILPHNIDLMHQERNVAKSIISMCFDVTGFSKESVNARKDLADLCNVNARKEHGLHIVRSQQKEKRYLGGLRN
jgi:hypothetical protein